MKIIYKDDDSKNNKKDYTDVLPKLDNKCLKCKCNSRILDFKTVDHPYCLLLNNGKIIPNPPNKNNFINSISFGIMVVRNKK